VTNNIREGAEQASSVKRLLLGEPIASDEGAEMILLTGGLALLAFTPLIAALVVVLLIVVVLSYRQLVRAYPSGGGDYEVARTNLGEIPGVVVAAALLVDYVLTVAVSVASGVDNIISAVPHLAPWRIELAIVFVVVIVIVNLRGVREASFAFAIPTYVFVGSVAVMIVTGLVRTALGDEPVASSAGYAVHAPELAQVAVILLVLRAFSSGCSALTGVEAVANGVPAFRRPKVRNAQATLALMGSLAVFLFAGLTALALISGVHYAEDPCDLVGFDCSRPQPSLIAQVASATFGSGSFAFFIVQAATACVLLLAANTAFNGFPLLGAVLARDGYAPKSLNTRGDRLVFSNGMLILGAAAIAVLLASRAQLSTLVQLYIIGVFVSFTLGQIGMVRHWRRRLRTESLEPAERRSVRTGLTINSIGATLTVVVLVVVTITKFTHGAYLVFLAIPVLAVLMIGVRRYYRDVEHELVVEDATRFGASGDIALVLVSRMQKPVLKALDYAIAAHHAETRAVHVAVDSEDAERLAAHWRDMGVDVPLILLDSPYRTYAEPLVNYITALREEAGPSVVTVYLPQYIVGHWWEALLHNRRARRLASRLMLVHGVAVTLVPWLLDSSELVYGRRSRPLPGQDRAGRYGAAHR
jgi:amino acid transporter